MNIITLTQGNPGWSIGRRKPGLSSEISNACVIASCIFWSQATPYGFWLQRNKNIQLKNLRNWVDPNNSLCKGCRCHWLWNENAIFCHQLPLIHTHASRQCTTVSSVCKIHIQASLKGDSQREREETCNKCLDPNFGRVLYCRKREAFSLSSPGAMVIIVVQILINFISTADWNWSCCLWAAKKPLQHKPCWTQQTWRWQSHRLVVRSFGPEKPKNSNR